MNRHYVYNFNVIAGVQVQSIFEKRKKREHSDFCHFIAL